MSWPNPWAKFYLFTLSSCAAEDTDEQCSSFADAGECEANPSMMLESCCVSCGGGMGGGALPYFLYLGQLSQFSWFGTRKKTQAAVMLVEPTTILHIGLAGKWHRTAAI